MNCHAHCKSEHGKQDSVILFLGSSLLFWERFLTTGEQKHAGTEKALSVVFLPDLQLFKAYNPCKKSYFIED